MGARENNLQMLQISQNEILRMKLWLLQREKCKKECNVA